MKIDITSMFFNSKIEGQTATAAWGTSIGQNRSTECRIDDYKQEIIEVLVGMTYKSVAQTDKLDVSKGSSNRETLMCSVFTDIYVNGKKIDNSQFVLLLVRELSNSHKGRLIISYAPYIRYGDKENTECINSMQSALGCTQDGCWFVYDITIKNQSQLHFSAVVVNNNTPMIYNNVTSQERTKLWRSLIPQSNNVHPLQKILYGTPGSGKSRKVKNEIQKEGVSEEFVFRTTFHPDSDYASFVGCYKPKMDAGEIVYRFAPQAFTKAYIKAWKNKGKQVYLVIEEINRGNCAQIFGDLFQLLDRKGGVSEYPINADADLQQYLEGELDKDNEGIKNGKLCLPANFNIVATMNTSDQSLFPMDSAFKRRWSWECVPVDYNDTESGTFSITIGSATYNWLEFLKVVNEKIKKATDSEDKQMGNFFISGNIDEREFIDKVMFYLWNDICKDEMGTQNNFFRYYSNTENTETEEFSFNELFGNDNTKILTKFMEYLDVKNE